MARPRNRRKNQIQQNSLNPAELDSLASRVKYVGSPLHKRNPGDYGLHPPAAVRPQKTLCDDALVVTRKEAQTLLEAGVRKGLLRYRSESDPSRLDEFPQVIWAVKALSDGSRIVLEARHNNSPSGHYHGYPLLDRSPTSEKVLRLWDEK